MPAPRAGPPPDPAPVTTESAWAADALVRSVRRVVFRLRPTFWALTTLFFQAVAIASTQVWASACDSAPVYWRNARFCTFVFPPRVWWKSTRTTWETAGNAGIFVSPSRAYRVPPESRHASSDGDGPYRPC